MPVLWNKEDLLAKFGKRADDTCNILGAQMVTWAVELCPVDTGNLTNSITYSTDTTQSKPRGKSTGTSIAQPTTKHTVRNGSNVVYAAAVEFGYTGTDKRGRKHNRPAKSFLRSSQTAHRSDINKIVADNMRG